MLRLAEKKDIPEIVELAVESVNQYPWPLQKNRRAMREAIELAISQECAWVSEKEKVLGAVVGVVHPGFWFSEKQASLLMFYCPTGGEGYKLLKKFADFVKSSQDIGMAVVSLEDFHDERYVRMFKRLGFTKPAPNFVYVRQK